jgi:FkbM family methyltransferase
MFSHIELLVKNKGYVPSAILDIGANKGEWTTSMKSIYPESIYYLFEASDYTELNHFNDDKKVYLYKNTLLNDKIDEIYWYTIKGTGDSMYKEQTSYYKNIDPIKRKTINLDTIIQNDNILKNDNNIFIKIDCQGAEIPILKGATSILHKTDFILLEIPFFGEYNKGVPNFLEHIKYMDSIGFIPYDIVEAHYIFNCNMQVDIIFINKTHKFNEDIRIQMTENI